MKALFLGAILSATFVPVARAQVITGESTYDDNFIHAPPTERTASKPNAPDPVAPAPGSKPAPSADRPMAPAPDRD